MNTSILTVVLAGAVLAGQNGTPTWQNSYATAQKMGTEQQKPVLVVIGSGANGWSKVIREAAPSAEVTQMMAKYVCCYIDSTTPEGKKLAQSFEITGSGLVISDRSGTLQAFSHQGDLSNTTIVHYLKKYSAPGMAITMTETNPARRSFYPETSTGAADVNTIVPSSSYCPSCNNARGRR